jgi:hypothetical protein
MAWLNFSVLPIAWHIIVVEKNAALEETIEEALVASGS